MKARFIKSTLLKLGFLPVFLLLISFSGDNFKKAQLKFSRVKTAYTEKWPSLVKLLKEKHIDTTDFEIYLRAFKYDKKLEVWARDKKSSPKFIHFKTYDICATSGDLGPKRQEGDGQIPEGFYEIDLLNPTSNYYLSMRVNYPNYSDRLLGNKKSLGGAIMIHGNCVTIGCMPITDECIKELYVLAVETKNKGAKIAVDIFPCYFNDKNYEMLKKNYSHELLTFWNELRDGYNYFEKKKYTALVTTDKDGHYSVKD
jgi:murein L,D-transpeptidase YafK